MDIVRLFGRPWSELVTEYTEAELLGWYRVWCDPGGKGATPQKHRGGRHGAARVR